MIAFIQNLLELLPQKAVIHTSKKAALLRQVSKIHPIAYTEEALTDYPIIPFQVWAAQYALDIVLVSKHPHWNMHEFAQLHTPKGKVWVMKDADEATRTQSIVTDAQYLGAWLPELPIQQQYYPIQVCDESTNKRLDIGFEYQNRIGELVKASYQGKFPTTKMRKRNGSTMGHSKDELLVVLDLPVRDFGKRATIQYDEKKYPIKRLLGIQPFAMALQQTQAGLSTGEMRQFKDEDGQIYTQHRDGIRQVWNTYSRDEYLVLEQENPFRTTRYHFLQASEDTLCLERASVRQWDSMTPSFEIEFYPALPDIRKKFASKYSSYFFMNVGGEKNHAMGTVDIHWKTEDELCIDFYPKRPWWVRDRPLRSLLYYDRTSMQWVQKAIMRPS